jgi:tetratricopeptide (TPR) repeat protein
MGAKSAAKKFVMGCRVLLFAVAFGCFQSNAIAAMNLQQKIIQGKEIVAQSLFGKGEVSGYYLPGFGVVYVIEKASDKAEENVDFTLVQTYPEAISLYVWSLPSHDFLAENEPNVVLIFDGGRVVQATAHAHQPLPEFDLKIATNHIKIYVDHAPAKLSASPDQVAQFLTVNGRNWLNEYDPNARTLLLGYTKDKPEYLETAKRFFETALQVNPNDAMASQLIVEAENKLKAYHLYDEATRLVNEHKRELERASRSGQASEIAKRSYWLWHAVDLFEEAIRANPGHQRAAKDLQDLLSALSSYPRLTEQQIAEMEEQRRREFVAKTRVIPYNELDSRADDLKGTPIEIRGEVAQLIATGLFTTTYAARLNTRSFTDTVYLVFRENPADLVEGDRIVVYGTVDGYQSYTSIAGWRITIPKVNVEYYSQVQ